MSYMKEKAIKILNGDWDCQICGGNHLESKCPKNAEIKEEMS